MTPSDTVTELHLPACTVLALTIRIGDRVRLHGDDTVWTVAELLRDPWYPARIVTDWQSCRPHRHEIQSVTHPEAP